MIESLNRQRIVSLLDLFYGGDIEGALTRLTDDVEFLANAPVDIFPHMGPHRGKAELRQMWQTIHADYSSMRYELPIMIAEGERVAANIRVYFRKRRNERMVQFDIATFYTLRDGKVSHIREIIDTFDLVQQMLERDIGAMLSGETPERP
jgi:ketosteroid isomerase-like protein